MPAGLFSHGCVRDLAWAGFSPTLLTGNGLSGAGLELTSPWREQLAALDADPTPLLEFLGDAPDGRLGLYYERLWHYLLQHDPDIDFLAHNLPVRDGSRTVGEFDCLYWSRREQRHIHLELAVKFYLGIPEDDIWLGPGGRDRLDIKLDRLVNHQSRLAEHPAASDPLARLGIAHCDSRIDIKGYLFTPGGSIAPPPHHNPLCTLQPWYTLSEFRSLEALPTSWLGWRKIPRHRWLSPFLAETGASRNDDALLEWLTSRFAGGRRPVQLAACDADGVEHSRCFVTPDGWPQKRGA